MNLTCWDEQHQVGYDGHEWRENGHCSRCEAVFEDPPAADIIVQCNECGDCHELTVGDKYEVDLYQDYTKDNEIILYDLCGVTCGEVFTIRYNSHEDSQPCSACRDEDWELNTRPDGEQFRNANRAWARCRNCSKMIIIVQ